jgi:hypothetical protein
MNRDGILVYVAKTTKVLKQNLFFFKIIEKKEVDF